MCALPFENIFHLMQQQNEFQVFAVVLLSSEVTPAPAPIKDIINAFVPQLTKPGLKK